MRKFLCIMAFCVCALSVSVNAQKLYEPHIHIGAKGGATFSSVIFSPEVDQSMTTGVLGGVSFRYAEEKYVGLMAELNFAQRGWKESFEEGEPYKYSRTLSYIQLPLMTHIFFGSKRVKYVINLGPEISYMLDDNISSNFDYKKPPQFANAYRTTAQLDMPIQNRFDYGITGGLGIEVKLNRLHSLMLEGRYYFGLGNIYNAAKKDVFDASRHSSIQVSLAYYYRLK